MNIVISGGWGYGNQGDDAILNSSIELLLIKYPGCSIKVLTYDFLDSSVHARGNVSLHYSAHRLIDLGSSELLYRKIERNYGFLSKVRLKLLFTLAESQFWLQYALRSPRLQELEELIKGADLFLMSGGGYFNEKWISKTRSNLAELAFAKKHGIPYYILGPTIGTFSPKLSGEIRKYFSAAQKISVRDENSYAEVIKYKAAASLIPDIALSTWRAGEQRKDGSTLGVIFTNPESGLLGMVTEALRMLMVARPSLKIRLFISRRWKTDFENAMRLQASLLAVGVPSEIILASAYDNLEEGLAACDLVISENLHGLILASRNLVPVVAINDYPVGSPNFKKFIAFLKQTESGESYISSVRSAQMACGIFEATLDAAPEVRRRLASLREQVRLKYLETL